MAPEQVQGTEADTRTDIFALGVVLYEMVTGTRAFSGASRTALIAAILEQAPVAMRSLQREAPAALERLVSVCLAKAPGDRWQSARDVTLMLRSIATEPTPPASPGVTRSGRHWIAIALAATGMLALAAAGLLYYRRPAVAAAPIAFTIPAPAHARPRVQLDPFTTLSPDGRHVAFTLRNPEGGGELWVRSLDAVEARMLPGTEGAFVPFWSPDSTKIGFFTLSDEQLKVVGYAGGPVRVLCPAGSPLGGTWNRDGTILFSGTTSSTDRTGPAADGRHGRHRREHGRRQLGRGAGAPVQAAGTLRHRALRGRRGHPGRALPGRDRGGCVRRSDERHRQLALPQCVGPARTLTRRPSHSGEQPPHSSRPSRYVRS